MGKKPETFPVEITDTIKRFRSEKVFSETSSAFNFYARDEFSDKMGK